MQTNAPSLTGLRLMGRGECVSMHPRARTAGWLLALVFSLLLSPLLSRMHQVVHSGHGAAAMAAQTPALAATGPEALAPTERSVFERLFGQHAEGSPVCQLLDHSSTSDGALQQANAALSDLPTHPWLGQSQITCATSSAAYFQARGPPAFL